jgi:hypothetical protein
MEKRGNIGMAKEREPSPVLRAMKDVEGLFELLDGAAEAIEDAMKQLGDPPLQDDHLWYALRGVRQTRETIRLFTLRYLRAALTPEDREHLRMEREEFERTLEFPENRERRDEILKEMREQDLEDREIDGLATPRPRSGSRGSSSRSRGRSGWRS